MAGRILKDDVDALRVQADIVAVVSEHTAVRRAGRSYKGLCPFHTERTPSFTVTPDGNFFHCFGCGASGDVYDFLMRVEGLDFPEAVESLARRSGFPLRYEQRSAKEMRALGERTRLLGVTRAARDLFRRTLLGPDGVPAREYLKGRGFGRAEADAFELGYAPDRWEDLSRALIAEGLPAEDLIAVGVSVRNDRGGLRDRFRGRLIFPIHDAAGDVIGFGGRVLPGIDYGDFDPPKYLNSPETALYHKSRVLYGLTQARSEVVARDQVLVCEGYTDVIALHQAGFANAVATCGTAVGPDHLRQLGRFTKRVVLAFDGDRAGEQAAERAWEAAASLSGEGTGSGIQLSVLVLPEGRDPADLAAAVGAEGVRAAVGAAVPVVPFLVDRLLARADLTTETGRAGALREAIAVLGREPDPDLRRAWARAAVADPLGVPYDFVVRSAARQGVELDPIAGVAVGAGRGGRDASRGPAVSADRSRGRLERAVLRLALRAPSLLPPEWAEVDEDVFTHPRARAVWRAMASGGGAGAGTAAILDAAEDDEVRALVRELGLEDDPLDQADEVVRRQSAGELVRGLVAKRVAEQERELRGRLAQVNVATDPDAARDLQRRLQDLGRRRRALTERDD